ncbi:MAG: hypothetical protein J6Q55_00300, partial [Clostridia bacterium]|nr:hypothetical protein [Clostridia bacterium]
MKKLKQYSDQFYECWSGRHCETFYTYLDDEINHFNWVYHHTKRTKEGDKKVQEIWIGLHKFRCLKVSHCEKAYYIYYCESFCTMMEGMYSSDGAMW